MYVIDSIYKLKIFTFIIILLLFLDIKILALGQIIPFPLWYFVTTTSKPLNFPYGIIYVRVCVSVVKEFQNSI